MRIVSIDIGVRNFAACVALVDDVTHQLAVVEAFYKIDLLNARCRRRPYCTACANHQGGGTMMMDVHGLHHVLSEHPLGRALKVADVVLVEDQPPQGIRSVQAVLCDRFMARTRLLSPSRFHKHMGFKGLDYDARKAAVEKIARQILVDHAESQWLTRFDSLTRKHDVADALCFVKYHVEKTAYKGGHNAFAGFSYVKTSSELRNQHTSQMSSWARLPTASEADSTPSSTTCTSCTETPHPERRGSQSVGGCAG